MREREKDRGENIEGRKMNECISKFNTNQRKLELSEGARWVDGMLGLSGGVS